MQQYRVRIFLTESRWTDTVITADNWVNARDMASGQSPIGKAIYLGEVVSSDW